MEPDIVAKHNISSDFPFASNFIEILGSRMHYIDEGEGDPILFLHGNPTSSYLWRNIIPYVIPHGRCIAVDLIGMGKSDKPDLDYRFLDHVNYVEAFIDALPLKNITLVLHDWGSGLGFHYAASNEYNVKALAFMEAILRPMSWSSFPIGPRIGFKLFRMPGIGWILLSVMNLFLRGILPQMTIRDLPSEEMKHYLAPYLDLASRKPVRQWPCEIPLDGEPADMVELVSAYSQSLQKSNLPKLLLYADPGAILTADDIEWCRRNLKNLQLVALGKGLHYLQEDHPHEIGAALAEWYQEL